MAGPSGPSTGKETEIEVELQARTAVDKNIFLKATRQQNERAS